MSAEHMPLDEATEGFDGWQIPNNQYVDMTQRGWCDVCLTFAVVPWTFECLTFDHTGCLIDELGRSEYCLAHDDFVEVEA